MFYGVICFETLGCFEGDFDPNSGRDSGCSVVTDKMCTRKYIDIVCEAHCVAIFVTYSTDGACEQVQLAKDPEDTRLPLEDKGFAVLLSTIREMVNSDEEGYSHYLAKEKIVCLHMKGVLEEIGTSKDSGGSRVLKVC